MAWGKMFYFSTQNKTSTNGTIKQIHSYLAHLGASFTRFKKVQHVTMRYHDLYLKLKTWDYNSNITIIEKEIVIKIQCFNSVWLRHTELANLRKIIMKHKLSYRVSETSFFISTSISSWNEKQETTWSCMFIIW